MRDMLASALDREGLAARFRIEETGCLGGCSRRCRISVANPNRWSWLLSDLRPQDGGAEIVQFLRDWEGADLGLIPKDARSAWLLTHAIGRLPPLR
jgi:predicted metal-binding protein